MTSKATGLIFCPSWSITFRRPRFHSAISFPLHLQQRLLLFLFIIVFGLGQTEAGFIIHRTAQRNISDSHSVPAYNFGILIDASERSTLEADCTNDKYNLIYPMAAEYSLERLRQDSQVPIGFYAIDTCGSRTAAMHQALAFLPNSLLFCKSNQPYSDVLSSIYVFGVVSTLSPTHTSPAFTALNAARMPSIGLLGVEKKLSNRKRYPNLYQMSPIDDVVETTVIPLLLKYSAWYYISVVHEDQSVFRNTFHKLKAEMELICEVNRSECLCLATVQTLKWDASTFAADQVVNELVKQKEEGANVVVVIASFPVVLKLFEAVNRHSPLVQFVWIATQSWVLHFLELVHPSVCAQFPNTLFILSRMPPRFSESNLHFQTYINRSTDASWYKVTLRRYLCKDLNPKECNNAVWQWLEDTKHANVFVVKGFMKLIRDLHEALDISIVKCAQNSSVEADCIRENIKKILNFLFGGIYEPRWAVFSYRGYDRKFVIAMYENNNYIPLQPFTLMAAINKSMELSPLPICVMENWNDTFKEEPLFSGCRPDCKPQEKHVARKPKECCWRCVKCRHYEIVTENRTSCEMCPETKWPDNTTNFTACYSLPVVTSTFSDYWPEILVTMAVSLIALDLGVIAFFLWNRKERVIKATSIQLSMLMQLGLILGSASIIVSCATASPLTCPLSAVLYDLSSSLLLCPLFMRTLLIFRIFRQRHRVTVSMNKWISLCLLLVVIQPILSLMEYSSPKTSQPDRYETYVELHCDYIFTLESAKRGIQMDVRYIVHFLKTAYTSLLNLLCLGLAYHLRHLPNNFNESAFILVCITTEITSKSLISSGAAVHNRNLQKMYFYNLGYALNLLLYVIFLFFTKIYAVLFVVRCQEVGKTARTTIQNARYSTMKIPAHSPSYIQKITDKDGSIGSRAGLSTREVIAEDPDEAKLGSGTPGGSPESTSDALSAQGLQDKQVTLPLLTNYDKVGTENVLPMSQKSGHYSSADDATSDSARLTFAQTPDMKESTDEGSEKLSLDTLSLASDTMESMDEGSEKLSLDALSTLASDKQESTDEVYEKPNLDALSTLASDTKESTEESYEKMNLIHFSKSYAL